MISTWCARSFPRRWCWRASASPGVRQKRVAGDGGMMSAARPAGGAVRGARVHARGAGRLLRAGADQRRHRHVADPAANEPRRGRARPRGDAGRRNRIPVRRTITNLALARRVGERTMRSQHCRVDRWRTDAARRGTGGVLSRSRCHSACAGRVARQQRRRHACAVRHGAGDRSASVAADRHR